MIKKQIVKLTNSRIEVRFGFNFGSVLTVLISQFAKKFDDALIFNWAIPSAAEDNSAMA